MIRRPGPWPIEPGSLDAGSPVERVVFDVFSARDESLYRSLLA